MKEAKSRGWKNVIYNSYDELPEFASSYDNKEWIEKQIIRADTFDREADVVADRNRLLMDYVERINLDNVNILDYGGGFGLSYLSLAGTTNKNIDYHVVELPGVSDAANQYFHDNSRINFTPDIPIGLNFDIVYVRTALQYTMDWKQTICDLTKLQPKYFILAHLSAGDIPTFLTLQLWGEYEIPYWFINKHELIQEAYNRKYECILDSFCYDMKNDTGWKPGHHQYFSEDYRLDKLINLVFQQKEAK